MRSTVTLGAAALSILALTAPATSALPLNATGSDAASDPSSADYGLLFARRDAPLSDCLSAAQAASTNSNGHRFGISTPSSSNYAALSTSYNPLFHYKPSYVLTPTSGKDVKAVMQCLAAQKGRVKLTPKGGGHSYAAFSLGGDDGSVVVDLRHLDTIAVDAAAKTATVGAGVRLGTLAQTIWDQGRFALPHGTCPMVGVAGHSLGGGFGYATRAWGYLMDRIESLRVVLPSGSIVTASPSENQDLFWALRGGGSNNFGVVTAFTFRLESAPSQVINYSYNFKTNDDCARALVALQKWTEDADAATGMPKELGGELLVSGQNGGDFDGNACQLSGQHLDATPESHRAVMQRFLDQVPAPASSRVQPFGWLDSLTDIMGSLAVTPPAKDHEQFYAKSLVTPPSAQFTHDQALELIRQLDGIAGLEGSGNSISFDFLGPLSYPATTGSQQPSSFNAHGAMFVSQFYSYDFPASNDGGQQDRVHSAFDSLVATMQRVDPSAKWGAYVNYVDARLPGWAQMYYGDALDRLKSLKARYDPDTVLDFPQGLAHA
ncbi:uncharacterized protein PFL1_04729 [Pseudozyma flocculosa PF-1]|uniref:Related to Reticuline oxidase n=2 Tax=Pseudozyma flocculosa TaxID=84751 RepID=A0A5C3F4K3_9BASI|nr:uncharacterized protein PFL1_04729 [Pseudozyma flocculosa PF-1]EPQ27591.1 hypothetical protein PFL1_04729 [Pseudozyma flocculosa PF-1]SPO39282.1 related to Reticuline oxidase precursor [Pseudozyma flocculosa]